MSLSRRENTLLVPTAAKTTGAGGYDVTAYPVGAMVNASSSDTTIPVDAGHSFRVGDKYLLNPGTDNTFSGTDTVSAVTATQITVGVSVDVAAGDALVNLGPDTGTSSPEYDGSPLPIYSDADGSTAISNSRVEADSVTGEYGYWHKGDGRFWELIRDGSDAVVDVVKGFGGSYGKANAVDFGVTLDNSTDDGPSINAAILSGASEVFIPEGSVNLDTKITIPTSMILTLGKGTYTGSTSMTDPGTGSGMFDVTASDVTIRGVGNGTVITQANAADLQTCIYFGANDRFRLERVKIDWNDENQTNASGYFTGVRSTAAADECTIENCHFTRAGDRAIDIRGSRKVLINGNRFIDTGITTPSVGFGNCVSVDVTGTTRSEDVIVSNNYFENFGDTAIGIPQVKNGTVTGNIIRGATDVGKSPTANEGGISLNGCERVTCTGNVLRKLLAAGIGSSAKSIAGVDYPSRGVIISGNTLVSGLGLQTIISQQANVAGATGIGIVISNNSIDLADDTSATASAITCGGTDSTENIVISNNVLRVDAQTSAQAAIRFSGTAPDQYTITGNVTDNFFYGVELQSNVGAVGVIDGNNFINASAGVIEPNTDGVIIGSNKGAGQSYTVFTASDATPDVSAGSHFRTQGTAVTITNFDGGYTGQMIFLSMRDSNTTIQCSGANLNGNGGTDFTTQSGDMMIAVKHHDGHWNCFFSDKA